jgi:hypothetical protein
MLSIDVWRTIATGESGPHVPVVLIVMLAVLEVTDLMSQTLCKHYITIPYQSSES